MRLFLRLAAMAVAFVSLVFWLFGGPNLGWTRNRVPIQKTDPVTGQQYQEWESRFIPGVDFVGGAFLLAGVALGASCFCRRPADTSKPVPEPEK
jgi:hypothetical protein